MTFQTATAPEIAGFARPILLGTALAGTLDAIDGVVFNGIANGLNPTQVLQYIASTAANEARH